MSQPALPLAALACALVASHALAQNNNWLVRNNEPYSVISTATHPTTGNNYNWAPCNHPGYSSGAGVPAGARIWKTYDTHISVRQEAWRHVGFAVQIYQSAATTNYNYYEPATSLYGATPRAGGVGWDPDLANQIGTATVQMPTPINARSAMLTVTFAPVTVRFDQRNSLGAFAIVSDYNGGEEQNLAGDPTTGVYSQGFAGSWMDGPVLPYGSSYAPDGFWDQTAGITYKTDTRFRWRISPIFDNPTMNVYSDYGQRRQAQATALKGHSDGSYYADIASQSFNLGVTVRAGTSFATGSAVVLMNVQPAPFGFGTPIPNPWSGPQRLVVELAPFDPFLLAISGFTQPLDQDGNVDFDLFGISGAGGQGSAPPIPGLLGLYVGFEGWVLDPLLSASDTTDAVHVRVSL